MSWKDDIQLKKFEITTGDKKKWFPLLTQNYTKNIEYNGTEYTFVNKAGTLFARRLPKGRNIPLEFAFTGENNVETANAFELSARDQRAWQIIHPFYGNLTVQPQSISIDNNGLDSTIVKTVVIESLIVAQPKEIQVAKDSLSIAREKTQLASYTAMAAISSNLPVKDIELAKTYTNNIANRVEKTNVDYKTFKENYNQCLNELNNFQGITSAYINYAQKLIDMPAQITMDIGSKWRVINDSFNYFVENIKGIATPSYFERLMFNLMGCLAVNSMGVAITQENTFKTRKEVSNYTNKYIKVYNTYLATLYDLENETFQPDHDYMFAIHSMVCETTYLMYQILFESKQEREYLCERDTNLIILAHRLLGSASETNIQTLKDTNKVGLSEILNIKKDRKITYLV